MHQRLRRASAILPLVFAVACGDRGVRDPIGHLEEEVTVCAKGPTVEGVDVSYYQGSIDWTAVKGSGRVFAIARISDGTFMDAKFDANWSGMKSVGLVRGAYQFFRPGTDPTVQADIVVKKVGKLGDGDLPVTCDVEANDGQSAATIIANLHTWMTKVEAGTGKKPIIYTGKYFWQDSVADTKDFSANWLWIAAYGPTCPNLPDAAWSDWRFFQYTDKASVSGISGGVDGDKFNGTLADLQKLAAGGGVGGNEYAAQYVAQSWPPAVMPFPLVTGQQLDAYIEMKNTGTKPWNSNTRLATTNARDRKSPFTGPSWLSADRVAAVKGTVPPGGSFKFQFKWHAPSMVGTYDEHFGLVQEGVAWFGDQGGPADGVIEAKIDVIAAKYAAQFVSQSFPASDMPLTLRAGDKVDGFIELKNIGIDAWKAGETKLVPTPRDKPSPLGATGWLSPTRISSPTADVPPGGTYKFPVTLTGNTPGDVVQTFGLVEEGVAWFADPPSGGGPSDDFLKVHVMVVGADGDAGIGVGSDSGGSSSDGGAQAQPTSDEAPGGCGCRTTGNPRAPVLGLLVAAAMIAMRRRR